MGLNGYFSGSKDEARYGDIRLQPLSFEDDVARMAKSVIATQKGNVNMAALMKDNQLEVNPDKT